MKKGLFKTAIPFLANCLAPFGLFSQNCPDPNCPSIYFVSICLVTVDTASDKNLIVWDQDNFSGVDWITAVNIYKESNISGVYNLIATQPVTQLSEYLDMSSQPDIKSDRYKIAALDSCGCESAVSSPHKTIFLSASQQANNDVTLLIDGYEGLNFNFYDIFGGSSFDFDSSTVDSFGTFSSSLNAWTIPSNQLAITDTLFYVSIPIDSCVSTKKLKTYNASKSNTAALSVSTGIYQGKHDRADLISVLRDNTSSSAIHLYTGDRSILNRKFSFDLYDVLGRALFSEDILFSNNHYFMDMNIAEKGVYFYEIRDEWKAIGKGKLVF